MTLPNEDGYVIEKSPKREQYYDGNSWACAECEWAGKFKQGVPNAERDWLNCPNCGASLWGTGPTACDTASRIGKVSSPQLIDGGRAA